MFNKVLIANRGEVALRIMRTCRDMNVKTVAAYSEEDAETYRVQYADEGVCIGPASAADSYLSIGNIIMAAKATGAEAIHPGYGFLSENASFALECAKEGVAFIGPSAECIERMGNRSSSRAAMANCGVPTVPGSDSCIDTVEEASEFAERIGYPVLIKAAAGNGGKGTREVRRPEDLASQYQTTRVEAGIAFGNDDVYMEKLILSPRHIEIQVIADDYGNQVTLCERDCSVQRHRQKLLEEAPSPALGEKLRFSMAETALNAIRAIGYRSVGTVEFLLDQNGNFYFIEINTRVQAGHPVTEEITGVDIIKEQLRIAAGEPMSCVDRAPFSPNGHAIEFRINAEDPERGFLPCPGTVSRFEVPAGPGVRVESAMRSGSRVSQFYDPLIAKLIVYGQDRDEALARAGRALSEFVIEGPGIVTTIPFHQRLLEYEAFRNGLMTTDSVESWLRMD